jgi:hypothetical protein
MLWDTACRASLLGKADPHAGRVTVVPIVVGSISASQVRVTLNLINFRVLLIVSTSLQEAEYGAILAPYLADPANFFVVSSGASLPWLALYVCVDYLTQLQTFATGASGSASCR